MFRVSVPGRVIWIATSHDIQKELRNGSCSLERSRSMAGQNPVSRWIAVSRSCPVGLHRPYVLHVGPSSPVTKRENCLGRALSAEACSEDYNFIREAPEMPVLLTSKKLQGILVVFMVAYALFDEIGLFCTMLTTVSHLFFRKNNFLNCSRLPQYERLTNACHARCLNAISRLLRCRRVSMRPNKKMNKTAVSMPAGTLARHSAFTVVPMTTLDMRLRIMATPRGIPKKLSRRKTVRLKRKFCILLVNSDMDTA
jgi:hypothetical protein